MDVRNAYEELLAVVSVAAVFLVLGYVLLTGHGIAHYIGTRAEASDYPGVRIIREESSFSQPKQSYDEHVHVIHEGLRQWRMISSAGRISDFDGV